MDWLLSLGILLIMLGFAFITIALLRSAASSSSIEAGGVLLIGPFPLVFGTSERVVLLSILSAILILLGVIVWILLR